MSTRVIEQQTPAATHRRPPAVRRAARPRRDGRRLALELLAGAAIAGLALALIPGLALVAIVALLVLIGCAGSLGFAAVLRRGRSRRIR